MAKPVIEKSANGGRKTVMPPDLQFANPDSGVMSQDYNFLKELLESGKGEDLDARSEVNELQIIQYARARAMSKHYKIPLLNQFVEHLLRLSLSKGRKSRKEFVQAAQSAMMSDQGEAAGIMAGALGRMRT